MPAWAACCTAALAHEPDTLERMVISGRADSLVGIAGSASDGYVGRDHFEQRPLLRPGELLETVPGLIATQHSGNGKANQYYLRGFNLDHGTDFATFVDGVPVNLPTHAHGQGYTDVNFLIPELIERIQFSKGTHHAELGDFSSAGAARLTYASRIPGTLVHGEGGMYGHVRGLVAGSPVVGQGNLLYAAEYQHDDGPWLMASDFNKANLLLRYGQEADDSGWNVTAMGYHGQWRSTDQIPRRAVEAGSLARFGNVDPTDGGESTRLSLSGAWRRDTEHGHTEMLVYGVASSLGLHSNFTYFLDDPVRGDQFEQSDRRFQGGWTGHHAWAHELLGRDGSTEVGLQVRGDRMDVRLAKTQGRAFLDSVRADDVGQVNVSPYVKNEARWSDWLRSEVGARLDQYRFDVTDRSNGDSRGRNAGMASPKGSVVVGPWVGTELNVSGGLGFHSNDARGVTAGADAATPLARTSGAEVGVRTTAVRGLQSTLALWWLDSASELVFVGDAGTTEATRPGRRLGVEWANYYNVTRSVTLDMDLAWTHARYRDKAAEGDRIPGAPEAVASAGVTVRDIAGLGGLFGSVRLRYLGARPLVEDDSRRSQGTALASLQVGYQFNPRWRLVADVFNVLDQRADDITYFYASRLPGEPAGGVEDFHFHPVEPIQARIALTARF